jgi:3-methylfumaryl-CoA hydratase
MPVFGQDLRVTMANEDHREEPASLVPLLELAALLDHVRPPWDIAFVPPLGHWLYFHPEARQSELSADGHPHPTSPLPADLPPRRMWAGGRLRFLAPIPVGTSVQRRSVLGSVTRKSGRSGPLVFVELRHYLSVGGTDVVIEQQDIVYREAVSVAASPASAIDGDFDSADFVRELTLDPTALFRYSALTYNAHRIHYDRDYATRVEFYPGLVVQGPFLATLLVDHFHRNCPAAPITSFAFRARRPAFADRPLQLCLRQGEEGTHLWARTADGIVFTAEINADPESRT